MADSENRPDLITVQPGTKCDFCAWDGEDLTVRHHSRTVKLRREMILLWDDCVLNDAYTDLNICFLCRWYLMQPREHLDWIMSDADLERGESGTFPSNKPHS